MTFCYSESLVCKLEAALSADRLSTYQHLAGGDPIKALQLYVRNAALSEALYTPLQGVEVVVRNALHRQLIIGFGEDWYDRPGCKLEFAQQQKIDAAKGNIRSEAKPVTPGRVVSELSFGFWTGILGRKYENDLWRSHLRKAFAFGPRALVRKQAQGALGRIRRLRNRIMHHEPILQRDLKGDYELILSVIAWVCPDTAEWVASHNRFERSFGDAA